MERYLIFVAGALLGIIIVVIQSKKGGMGSVYDERQLAARGKAFKYGFFTFLAYFVLYCAQLVLMEEELIANYAAVTIGCCLSLFVFVVVAIWNDAYFSLRDKIFTYVMIFLSAGILGIFVSILEYIENQSFGFHIIFLFTGILFLMIDLVFGLKKLKERMQGDEN